MQNDAPIHRVIVVTVVAAARSMKSVNMYRGVKVRLMNRCITMLPKRIAVSQNFEVNDVSGEAHLLS